MRTPSSSGDTRKKSTYNSAAASGETPLIQLNSSAPGFFNGLAGAAGHAIGNGSPYPGDNFNVQAAEAALSARNNAGPKQDIYGGAGGFLQSAFGSQHTGGAAQGGYGGAPSAVQAGPGYAGGKHEVGVSPTPGYAGLSREILPGPGYAGDNPTLGSASGGTASGSAHNTASMLSAFANHGGGHAPDALSATGGFAPAPAPPGFAPASFQMPTLNMPSGDYNSYLSQAQKALDFAAIAQPYDQAINQVTNDTGISVGNIGAAAQGAQANIAAGSGLLQQTADHANANNAAVEQALAQQASGANASNGASTAAVAQALGTGSLQGQINSSAAQQNAAAQQYLAGSALDNSNTVNANAATQIADNQNYGRVVDAKATADQQNAELAGQDAKAGIGLQKGQSLLGAREQAATNAMGMQQNAIQNAIAQYNAQVQAGLGYGSLQQGEQRLGLDQYTAANNVQYQNNSLAAQVAGAKAGNLQNAYAPIFAALANAEKYGQVNSPLTGQSLGSAEQLAQAMLAAYGQQGYSPTISQGLLNGSQDSGIAPTLNDVLSSNGQTTKKKR